PFAPRMVASPLVSRWNRELETLGHLAEFGKQRLRAWCDADQAEITAARRRQENLQDLHRRAGFAIDGSGFDGDAGVSVDRHFHWRVELDVAVARQRSQQPLGELMPLFDRPRIQRGRNHEHGAWLAFPDRTDTAVAGVDLAGADQGTRLLELTEVAEAVKFADGRALGSFRGGEDPLDFGRQHRSRAQGVNG